MRLRLPVEIRALVHARVCFAAVVVVDPQRVAECVELHTLGLLSAVDDIVDKFVAVHCDGQQFISKCVQVG